MNKNGQRLAILADIVKERQRQDELHPEWHGDDHGLVVLTEEFGEVGRALYELKTWVRKNPGQPVPQELLHSLRSEAVQVAAVCVRWIENGIGQETAGGHNE